MDKTQIPFLSAAELSRLIESREVSPVEATEAYLDRIDDLDFKYNSYLTVCREQALEEARGAESAIAQGNYLGHRCLIPDVLVVDGRSTPNHYIVRSKSVGVNADGDPVVSPEVEIFYPVLSGASVPPGIP